MKPFKQYLKEAKSVDLDKAVYKKKIEGGHFVVMNRDTKGMRGTQDKFKMATVDDSGKIVNDLGSHPSEKGAQKFGDKVKSVSFDPMKESLTEAKDDAVAKYVNATLDLFKLDQEEAKNDGWTSGSFDKKKEKAMEMQTKAWDAFVGSGASMDSVRKALKKAGVPVEDYLN